MMSRPKRVLVVARSTVGHTGAGGMEIMVDDILRRLVGGSFDFSLLTTPGVDLSALEGLFSNVWTVPAAREGKYSFRWWWKSASTRSEWRTWDPEAIFSVSVGAGALALHPAWSSVPILSQCHGTGWHEVKSSFLSITPREVVKIPLNIARVYRDRMVYRRFTSVIAVSPLVARQLIRFPISVDCSRVKVISNAVDGGLWGFNVHARSIRRRELDIPAQAPVAVFAARLHYQKGADIALEAMAHLRVPDWHLILCGTGPEENRLRHMADDLGILSRVHFTGRLSRERLAATLSAADLMVFPTRAQESPPMNILEALASGLGVLTTERANMPQLFDNMVMLASADATSMARKWNDFLPVLARYSRLPAGYDIEDAACGYSEALYACTRVWHPVTSSEDS